MSDQQVLLTRQIVSNAANALQGLPGETATAAAPGFGTPVGIIEIGELKRQIEVSARCRTQTAEGSRHVPGPQVSASPETASSSRAAVGTALCSRTSAGCTKAIASW